ncbi:hypothetical protein BAU15_00960 [Enterococcus sp. JM4C]|uniref:hypothetical protein n=1 Tax=Candidatus Enterococcus huntleyi TaxID=1857217 RepID=UPI00137A763C|nr:hypothetical protein [Enterococcus sp. JM4C]KAF1299247.1 hypothetical protein BAU15_00960 [Enterococcus sp. JM4C]
MNKKIEKLLNNQGDNYIFPFFWQHGEDEETLRKYMDVIEKSNIKAVCVESRPHPDFVGERWWRDLDIILDEARRRKMKVWILDDSHFPTGFANGAMKEQPQELCRQSIACQKIDVHAGDIYTRTKEELQHPREFEPNMIEQHVLPKEQRQFDDDRLLGIIARKKDSNGLYSRENQLDLSSLMKEDKIEWAVPEGEWRIYLIHLSRNLGYHREYINMMDQASCKVLLDTVYEPHYERYQEDFGTTIAGFFSDEPELGNDHLYNWDMLLGNDIDLPWSAELEHDLQKNRSGSLAENLILLWENDFSSQEKAKIRYEYMDSVTNLVKKNFSMQIGDWCRERNVQYIGHLIEDNNLHARTGSSLGHYFRGLAGQDMAGIDDIGGQVMPQQEDVNVTTGILGRRDGEFFHYMLGKLGSSLAAIDPLKKGRAMCEIFGNYGWSEGVRLEKYLVDHFLVRGINHFVPHAFSPKAFPDPDCPPHFYAHGHNPQYRHFGALMAYTNRVCELLNDGTHEAPIAIIYHGESEWTGETMFSHKVGRILADNQMEYDILPQDVFSDQAFYGTTFNSQNLTVNQQNYRVVVVPYSQYVTAEFATAIPEMIRQRIEVLFIDDYPEGVTNEETTPEILDNIKQAKVVTLNKLLDYLQEIDIATVKITPSGDRIRYHHYTHEDGTSIYMFVNEGEKIYHGEITTQETISGYLYDAWENECQKLEQTENGFRLVIEPLKSKLVVFETNGQIEETQLSEPLKSIEPNLTFVQPWKRSLAKGIDYPAFQKAESIKLPDTLSQSQPYFSGIVRYSNTLLVKEQPTSVILEVTEAHEGVEVFVNKQSMGIQIVPPFRYDVTSAIITGENEIAIEVATTLEREMSQYPDRRGQKIVAKSESGITGQVNVYME